MSITYRSDGLHPGRKPSAWLRTTLDEEEEEEEEEEGDSMQRGGSLGAIARHSHLLTMWLLVGIPKSSIGWGGGGRAKSADMTRP